MSYFVFFCVLIVNCGEIVVCIIWILVELGWYLVVVYVEDDSEFLYVLKVDNVIFL